MCHSDSGASHKGDSMLGIIIGLALPYVIVIVGCSWLLNPKNMNLPRISDTDDEAKSEKAADERVTVELAKQEAVRQESYRREELNHAAVQRHQAFIEELDSRIYTGTHVALVNEELGVYQEGSYGGGHDGSYAHLGVHGTYTIRLEDGRKFRSEGHLVPVFRGVLLTASGATNV